MKHKLEKIFRPKTVAAIGASIRDRTVGHALMSNLLNGTYAGKVYPVNPRHSIIQGETCYRSVLEIPDVIDLAVIAAPARFVPDIIEECGRAGVGGVTIISAGFKEAGPKGKDLFNQIHLLSQKYNMRVIGPNCVGFINPSIGLNASFAANTALPGHIAFISQSGALCTAILDWSIDQSVGFSHFVSIGSMLDIGFNDLIDYFGNDVNTSCILIYMESLRNPRHFMSAARAFAQHKPIIVLKAGKSTEGARASLSHTGSLTGNDAVFSAAFHRAGVLQVDTIEQLFNCAQALAMQPLPKGNRLAIVTNAGGPGILGTDYLSQHKGKLAKLSQLSMDDLNATLPPHWSHGNPIDVLGDADAKKYCAAIGICDRDENVDAILAILTTTGVTDPSEVARALVLQNTNKPILACWMGEGQVRDGREILEQGRIPNYRYPENAVDVFLKTYQYSNHLKLLHETPPSIPKKFLPEREKARELISSVIKSGRVQLSETEAKRLLNYYGIPTPIGALVTSVTQAIEYAQEIGFPVVLKLASPDIAHKTDVSGVVLNLNSVEAVQEAYKDMMSHVKHHFPNAKIDGVRIEKMVTKKYELLVGAKKDLIFGPVIVFGSGGVLVELYNDICMGLPPLNMLLANQMMKNTKVYRLLKGYRGMPGVDTEALQLLLVKFAYLVMDFPEVKEIDINPYVVDEKGGMALDAHIVLDESSFQKHDAAYSHLVISPYPADYQRDFIMNNGKTVLLRPIRPEDEQMIAAMFRQLSKQSSDLDSLGHLPLVNHGMLVRYAQIDYDREMVLVAEIELDSKRKIAGLVGIRSDAWKEVANYTIFIVDSWLRLGLESAMTDLVLEVARDKMIRKICADISTDNLQLIEMLQAKGFTIGNSEADISYLEFELNSSW